MTNCSKASFKEATESGVIDGWKKRVYQAIKIHLDGLTYREAIDYFYRNEGITYEDRAITSAMNTLYLDGYVNEGYVRKCTVTGNCATAFILAFDHPTHKERLKRRVSREMERRRDIDKNLTKFSNIVKKLKENGKLDNPLPSLD